MHHDSDEVHFDVKSIPNLRRKLVIAVAVIVLIALWGGIKRYLDYNKEAKWSAEQAVESVAVIHPHIGIHGNTLVLPGTLQPYIDAPILARVDGYLKIWYHDIGAKVKKGELLAVIDTPELDQQLSQAKANLVRKKADEKLAEVTMKRWKALLAKDSVSKQETDVHIADFEARKADVLAAKADVARIEAFENFKRVVAPFDGIITARKTDVGFLISAGKGTELFNVSSVDPLRLYVPVPQVYSDQIKNGQTATLTVPEFPNRTFSAKVETTSGGISNTSGTMLVELLVQNIDETLKPGDYSQVRFDLPENKSAVRVPSSCLIFRSGGLRVAVLGADNHVMLKPIVVGRDYGSEVEVVSGLSINDQVIDSPSDSIENGDLVKPQTNSGNQSGGH
ncbi:efflux RND transporter periplasmic adaptor subunit [Ferrovum sp. PN-J185]|uniref:efflux RND transporter periplasmic adaptor subunit n=1 Tax=Ferrovum sp. PN-J185 TaxID=1356306 RepID=UPI000796695C|nr:efflux RND transporter periplasmic adaptor subunit [Ferrovum sp. PN-J185]KXW56131.1 multidrug resistance protein MdtA precursor [Ferrovum sp. PN-J185]MCC6067807.1 efflux RND transporter periplasmic adaptor subunit [Ferrovum sp. PN-J185]